MRPGVLAIDPSAKVAPGAVIGADVEIGPYCVIGKNVTIGDGCRLVAQVYLAGHTSIGPQTTIYPFASLGTPPQSTHYRGGPTRLVIGARCQIREGVTANIGTEKGGGLTTVGDDCFLMAGAHVGHDCRVGNNVTLANGTMLGGHCDIGDFVFIGGSCAVHQHVRLGESVMVGGNTAIREDAIPFGFVFHYVGYLIGLNIVGMRRRGIKRESINLVRRAYQALFEGGEDPFAKRVDRVAEELGADPEVAKIVAFLRAAKRPVMTTRMRGSHVEQSG
jgi:UDP-N-acetylglucosamine acyltransferase